MITIPSGQYQERGARGRIFTVDNNGAPYGFARATFTGGGAHGKEPRKGSGTRSVIISHATLRKRFVQVSP